MACTEFHYYSRVLDIDVSVSVILPEVQTMLEQGGKPLPTLYLLHGLSDDHTHWIRQTRLEFYARRYRLAIVMPCVNRSFYTDMKHGAKYFTFVSEELPKVMELYFPLSHEREERFAAGLSMGGYGAMKLGLLCPEKYAAVASLSGAVEMEADFFRHSVQKDDAFLRELNDIFGSFEEFMQSDNCLTRVAERLDPSKAPRMYMACGTADFLFDSNEDFVRRFGEKFSIRYDTEEGAAHTWDFWDRQIEKVLAWLNVPKAE